MPADKPKPARRSKPPAAPRGMTVAGLKSRIEAIDRELVERMHARAEAAGKLFRLLEAEGQPVPSLADDEQALAAAISSGRGPLAERAAAAALREVISGSRALMRTVRVAFLGPLYSYSHLAALVRFGQSVELAPVASIAAVFEEVSRRQANFGLVPIENSTDGRVADTLDMFMRLPIRICGQVELAIHHALLGKCPRSEIKEVYSKPQALSQCRNWIAKHLEGARAIEVTSTSTAAQLAKEKPGAAAVASIQAGVHYGLDVLAEQIEDNPHNTTRFAIIGDDPPRRTGNDRTAIMFETEHRFGALVDALACFKRNRLNMTWIESFPVPGSERKYLFFAEFEGFENDARVRKAVAALGRRALRLEVLGSYPAPAVAS